jgi:hypothetical protein
VATSRLHARRGGGSIVDPYWMQHFFVLRHLLDDADSGFLLLQRAEENTGLRRQMAEVEELLAKQRLEGDTLLKRVAVAEVRNLPKDDKMRIVCPGVGVTSLPAGSRPRVVADRGVFAAHNLSWQDQCRALQSECEMAKRALALEQAKLKKCQVRKLNVCCAQCLACLSLFVSIGSLLRRRICRWLKTRLHRQCAPRRSCSTRRSD